MAKPNIRVVNSKSGERLIQVFGRADASDCENLLLELPALKGATRLQIATDWGLDALPGGATTAMQTVITWARSQQTATLVTHAPGGNATDVLDRFCERLQGIAAVAMSVAVLGVDGTTDVGAEAWAITETQLAAMDRLDVRVVRRGQTLSFVCVDHSVHAALGPFYHTAMGAPSVKEVPEFKELIEELIPLVMPSHAGDVLALSDDLGTILHELFSNSHHHGRVDADRKLRRRSVRSVTLSERKVTIPTLLERDDGWTEMRDYLVNAARSSRSEHTLKVFELSVVDSGPGMAAHMAEADLPADVGLAAEQELVQRCFRKHVSGHARAGLGMGLPRVMQVVKDRGGLIKVRTGRLSLTRFFDPATAQRGVAPSDDDMVLVDSRTKLTTATARGKVAGTAVTILIPVGLKVR